MSNFKNPLIISLCLSALGLGFTPSESLAQSGAISGDVPLVSEIQSRNSQTVSEESKNNEIGQYINISAIQDVDPTSWAYEALRNLVERYGCIAGYPDGTFRGTTPLSRWEFAAGLNACLTSIEQLIQESGRIATEDIETLRKLESEFQAELAVIGSRVDQLDSRVAFLEENQFSTTTKLSALITFYLSGARAGSNITAEGANAFNAFDPPRDENNRPRTREVGKDDPNVTLSYLSWINFNTSFSGRDNLTVQFAAGNGSAPANQFLSVGFFNSSGTPFLLQAGAPSNDQVAIRELFYSFPATDNLQVVVGPRINVYRYFDGNRFTFFLNGAESFNSSGSTQFSPIDRGSGAVVVWDVNKMINFTTGYVGNNTEFLPSAIGSSASDPSRGLFGGTYNIMAQLTVSPTDNLNLRFLYNRSRLEPNPFSGYIGGAIGEPIPYGLADDGFGGTLRHGFANAYIFNFDWLVVEKFGLFGRYSWGSTNITPTNSELDKGDINSQSLQLGFALPDLGKPGAQATFSYLIPFSVVNGRKYLLSGGGNGGVQYEFEANYFYPINDNIAIVPSFYLIVRPNNFTTNGPIYVGNLRTQFSF